jgi:hypothetical protein
LTLNNPSAAIPKTHTTLSSMPARGSVSPATRDAVLGDGRHGLNVDEVSIIAEKLFAALFGQPLARPR